MALISINYTKNEYLYPGVSTYEILKKPYLLGLLIALGLGWKVMVVAFQQRKILMYEGGLSKLQSTQFVVI